MGGDEIWKTATALTAAYAGRSNATAVGTVKFFRTVLKGLSEVDEGREPQPIDRTRRPQRLSDARAAKAATR